MEGGLLSSQDLAPLYGEAAWMYLFQDFSGSEDDRRAERVAIRFGITAWPQHLLIDPTDLSVIGSTGRELATFQKAFGAAPAIKGRPAPTPEELAEYDSLAERIQTSTDPEVPKSFLGHEDIVVRYCAVAALAESEPESVAEASQGLLAVEHDQLRFLVCKVLLETPHPAAASVLEQLLDEPAGSKNPNRLRCEVAKALGSSGRPSSLPLLGRYCVGGSPNNSLTSYALDSVAAIALLDDSEAKQETRERAREILTASFPDPPPVQGDERSADRILQLARQVHGLLSELTGETKPFPDPYDSASRKALLDSWTARRR